MRIGATLLVTREIAESFPTRPDRVEECVTQAAEAMGNLAAERHRHLTGRPELTDTRDTELGFVELTFGADTESD